MDQARLFLFPATVDSATVAALSDVSIRLIGPTAPPVEVKSRGLELIRRQYLSGVEGP